MAASLKEQLESLFATFNSGGVVGLDIGSHSIKICELGGGLGKLKVDKFAVLPLSEAAIIEDEIQKPQEIIQVVNELVQTAGIKSKNLCIGLYGPNTMTKRMNVPDGTKEEIEDHILWESEQYISFGADDSKIDFSIIGDNEGGGKDVLVAAAHHDIIESYTAPLRDSKFNVKYVDLNVLALSNVFEEVVRDDLEAYSEGTLILDLGAQSTKIVVYKRGGPLFTKELPIGGGLITEEIQRQMAVSYEEAEDLKTSYDSNGNLPEEILAIVQSQIEIQVAEIKKNINFYITQGSAEKVEYCFITGGNSLTPGMLEALVEATGLDIQRLELFESIKIDESHFDLSQDEFNAIAPTVIGLGMRRF
ncbi:MAG TPA: type IV pilus assembly protein PilM [Bacteriovoracaceae bacterium]|nr:type IV pilus assembly protein PilM [Bacteriovoracaceae bacterium]